MNYFKSNFRGAATRLITSAGRSCTYIQVIKGTYNQETLSVTDTEATYAVTAHTSKNSYADTNNPAYTGKTIKTILIAGSDLTIVPKNGDKITTPDSTLVVERVTAIEYSAGVAAWKLLCFKV